MKYGIEIVLVALLSTIVFQDLKHRAISWILIPLLLCFQTLLALSALTIEKTIFFFLINLGFIVMQLICITAYFSFKNRKFINIVNNYLGIGDILFFLVLCLGFSPFNFILFYLCSLIITLLAFLLYQILSRSQDKEIPLAGAMALGLIVCHLAHYRFDKINFYQDIIQ